MASRYPAYVREMFSNLLVFRWTEVNLTCTYWFYWPFTNVHGFQVFLGMSDTAGNKAIPNWFPSCAFMRNDKWLTTFCVFGHRSYSLDSSFHWDTDQQNLAHCSIVLQECNNMDGIRTLLCSYISLMWLIQMTKFKHGSWILILNMEG